MSEFTGEVKGLDAVHERLEALAALSMNDANSILRKAEREGCKIVQAQMIADAPVRTGATKAAIKVRAAKRRRGFVGTTTVIGKGAFKGDQFYAAFLDLGWKWKPNKNQKNAKAAGKAIPGTHWIEKAWEKVAGAVKERVIQRIIEGIQKKQNQDS